MKSLADIRAYEMRTGARAFVQWGISLAIAGGDKMHAVEIFRQKWPKSRHIEIIERAAVDPGTATDATWAAPLVPPLGILSSQFVELLRPATVLGRLTGVRKVPFQIQAPRATAGSTVGWVGGGRPIRAGALALDSVVMTHAKVSGIVVFAKELIRSADPASESLIASDLTAAAAAFLDEQFLNPDYAAVEGVSPASITNGGPTVASTGSSTAAIEADFSSMVEAIGTTLRSPFWVVTTATALHLIKLRSTGGDRAFPNLNLRGGDIWGAPVLVSDAAAEHGSPDANRIVLIDAAEVLLAQGGADVDASENAAIELDGAPEDPQTDAAVMTSLFQENLVGIRLTQFVNWQRRRDDAGVVSMTVGY